MKKTKETRHLLSLILAVILLLCGITACNNDNNEGGGEEDTRAAETVIFFFPYSGLESQISQNITDIKTAIAALGGTGKSRIIVVKAINQINAKMTELVYADSVCGENVIDNLMQLEFNSDDQAKAAASLQDIFLQVKEVAPAKSYSIAIGSHGTAWLPAGTNISTLTSATGNGGPQKAFGTGTSRNQISHDALITAAKNSSLRFNYVFFDACLMSNIETIYDYRNICDYFISSAADVPSYGAPYEEVLKSLLDHNYADVTSNYVSFYENSNFPYACLSVTRCEKINELAQTVKMIRTLDEGNTVSLSDVQKYDGMRATVFYDLADYIHKVYPASPLLETFDNIMSQVVVNKASTESIFTALPSEKSIPVTAFCGISTSSPTANEGAIPLLQETAWYADTH